MHEKLGLTFRDRVTGFLGIAVGRVEYLTGCNQVLLAPPVTADGSLRESQWFDEQRLVRRDDLAEVERIVLDNGDTPGFDKAPPRY